jgi:heme/copper-type cytochrome/quinol oxidase subunit 2
MNNEQQINEALQWLQSTGQSLVDFTGEQAPLYCQEVLNWTFYSNMITVIIGIIWIIGSLFLIKPCIKAWNFKYGDNDKGVAISVSTTMALVIAFFFIPITIMSVVDMVKIKVAPRMVLVEHFQQKLK